MDAPSLHPLLRVVRNLALPVLTALALLGLLAAAGCQTGLEPAEVADLDFEVAHAAYQDPVPEPTVSIGDDGSLRVEGIFIAPCRGYDLTAELDGSDDVLRLEVLGDGGGGPDRVCATVIEVLGWTATVRSLPPGTYDLRIVEVTRFYAGDPNTSTRTLLETRVTVP